MRRRIAAISPNAGRVFAGQMLTEVTSAARTATPAIGSTGRLQIVFFASSTPCAATVCASSRQGEPALPKDEPIVRCRLEDLPKGQTDWQRIDELTDEEIEAAVRDDPDAASLADEQWFARAQLVIPAHLKHLFVQIDEDLMTWFRQQGDDWPAKINAALREHVAGQRRRRKRAG